MRARARAYLFDCVTRRDRYALLEKTVRPDYVKLFGGGLAVGYERAALGALQVRVRHCVCCV